MTLNLSPKRTLITLLSIIALLSLAHIGQLIAYFVIADSDQFDFIQLLDFDYEANLPSFYSSLALLLCAVLLWTISADKKRQQALYTRHWQGLALIFLFLSIDEASGLHEELGDFVESLALFEASGMLYFAWVVPYSLLLITFAFAYLKFVINLPTPFGWQFFACGSLFIIGAVGFETISATEADINGTETIKYSVLYTIEEICEMTAIAFFCNTLLRYLAQHCSKIDIKID